MSKDYDAEETPGPGAVMTNRQRAQIELEVISADARLRLTRLLRERASDDCSLNVYLIRQNSIINLANAVMNRPIFVLEPDDDGEYEPPIHAWHQGEFELIMRRPSTVLLIEILADLVQNKWMDTNDINEVLQADSCGIRLRSSGSTVKIELLPLPPLEQDAPLSEHPNIRQLFGRMDHAMQDRDWPLVLHTGASVFETLAKRVVPSENVQDKSLGSFFSAYRKHSKLITPFLDLIEGIYNRRNIEPLAGHGSTKDSAVTEKEAIQINLITRLLVRLENELAAISPKG